MTASAPPHAEGRKRRPRAGSAWCACAGVDIADAQPLCSARDCLGHPGAGAGAGAGAGGAGAGAGAGAVGAVATARHVPLTDSPGAHGRHPMTRLSTLVRSLSCGTMSASMPTRCRLLPHSLRIPTAGGVVVVVVVGAAGVVVNRGGTPRTEKWALGGAARAGAGAVQSR